MKTEYNYHKLIRATTARYLQTLGLEQTREALEEGLKGPAQVIQFEQFAQKQASGFK